jgi:hypothetical protein
LPLAELLDHPIGNFRPRRDDLRRIERVGARAEMPSHTEAADALLERRRDLREEVLELPVVPLTFLQGTPLV